MAASLAKDFSLARVYADVDTLLADPDVDLVLNLTHPAAHADINLRALAAGKHAYCEKPFALSLDEGKAVLAKARETGLTVTCAPDTVLGSGTRASRALIAEGAIGQPLYGKIHMGGAGHEHWHPNPAFYYQQGGGPMLDMGPYYLTSLVQMLGPIRSVEGRAVTGFNTRTIHSEPLKGTEIPVDTPTHYVGSLETVSGVIVQVLFSFDLKFGADGIGLPEIYGTEGTLRATHPNNFNGTPMVNTTYPGGELEEREAPETYPQGRGLGVLDQAHAIREARMPRADGSVALHVLDAMLAFHESERLGRRIELTTTCEQPPPMPEAGL
jgi:predicted dehydrogenase